MGCWGMGMTQSDEFCEIYDRFMEAYDEGRAVGEISGEILAEYREEFGDDDPVLHDVYFALAKAEWMCCAQSGEILDRVKQIIASGANVEFYRELGAEGSDLKRRRTNLEKFLASLLEPRKAPRRRKPQPKYEGTPPERGMVFWYRSKNRVFGAVVLEVLGSNNILVALSAQLPGEPKNVETVLEAEVYTAVWFPALLPPRRVHKIGMVEITGDYNGRAGLYQTPSIHFCENFGMDYQWDHEKRVLELPGRKMSDLLSAENLPAEFRNPERLKQLLHRNENAIWISV